MRDERHVPRPARGRRLPRQDEWQARRIPIDDIAASTGADRGMRVNLWTAMRSCQRVVPRRHRTPRLASTSVVACPNGPLRRSTDTAALRHRAGNPHSHVPPTGTRQPECPVRLPLGAPGPRARTTCVGETPAVDAMRRVRRRVTPVAVSRPVGGRSGCSARSCHRRTESTMSVTAEWRPIRWQRVAPYWRDNDGRSRT